MKKNLVLVTLICGFLYFILSAHSTGPASVANLDCTGVIGSGCGGSTCHGTIPSTQIKDTVLVLDDSGHVVTYYVPGNIYTLRIRGYNNSTSILPKFGFQITAVKHGTDSSVGLLISTSNVHVTYVTPRLVIAEHTHPLWCSGSGGFGTIYQADVQWVAPSADTVELRAIVNAVDTNGAAGPEDHWPGAGAPIRLTEGHPPTIFGPNKICVGVTAPISFTPLGGTWASSDPSIAAVSSGGNVTGISPGTALISYTTITGTTSIVFTTNPLPAAITGTRVVCPGGTTTLTDSTPGGTWFSSNPSIAYVSYASGEVSPGSGSVGTATITYKVTSTGCYKTTPVTVASGGVVTGSSGICAGDSSLFTHSFPGGIWYSSHVAAATVSSTGMVAGVSPGVSVISYSLGTTACDAQKTVTINACNTGATNPFAQTSELRVFPNPNNGSFALNVLSAVDEDANIVITNVVGAKVREFTIRTNEIKNIVLNEPPGTYFLSAITLSNKYFVKIVVE